MKRLIVIALGLALAACSGGGGYREDRVNSAEITAAPPAPTLADQQAPLTQYRFGPEDKLRVRVFGVSDLDTESVVDPEGFIAVPLVGRIQAAGKTAGELASALQASLEQKYIRNPQVSVDLLQALSQKITIDGSVHQPGRYAITGPTTLTSAVALAQGTAEYAKNDEVLVFRTTAGKRYVARFDLGKIRTGQAPDPAVYGNDVVVVGTNRARMMLKDVAQVAPFLGLFYLFR